MPLPGSHRDKKKEVLQEIVEPEVQVEEVQPEPEFLQEINEPEHEETIVEETPKKRGRKKSFGIF